MCKTFLRNTAKLCGRGTGVNVILSNPVRVLNGGEWVTSFIPSARTLIVRHGGCPDSSKSSRNQIVGFGPMFWLLSGPSGFTYWISFALVFSFYVLMSPNLCIISLLYLGINVLGDDAWIS